MNSRLHLLAASLAFASLSPALADDKAAPAAPQAEPAAATDPAKAILERAAAAARNLQAVTYSIDTKAVGGLLEGSNPPSRASVKALRAGGPTSGVNGWLVSVSGASMQGDTSKPFAVVWKSGSIEALDHDKKTLMERGGKSVMAPGVTVANRARLNDVLSQAPFQQALRASSFSIEGVETLDGVECDIIVTGGEAQTSRFAIARTDNFPRKIELVINNPATQSTITTLITGVRIETDASAVTLAKPEDFKLDLPEGFQEDRQLTAVQPRPAGNAPVVATPKVEDKPAETKPAEATPSEPAPTDKPAEPRALATPPAAKPLEVAQAGGDFQLKKSTGDDFRLSELAGKVVVVQFFGSWCLPCREWNTALHDAVIDAAGDKDVPMLAISTHERDSANATAELARGDWRYVHLLDGDKVAAQWGVQAYPATFVIDASGAIVRSWQGPTSDEAATIARAAEVKQAVQAAVQATLRTADAR